MGRRLSVKHEKKHPLFSKLSFTSHPTITAIQYVTDSVVNITQIGGGKAVGRERNGWERHMGRGMPIGLDAEFERPCKANFETCKRAWNIITISFTYIIYIKTPSQITSFVKSLFHSQPKSNYSPNWGPRAVRN